MKHLAPWFISFGLLCACAASPQTPVHTPVSITIETSDNIQDWQQAAERIQQSIPEYSITIAKHNNNRIFNQIHTYDGKSQLCLEPRTHYDFAGNLVSFQPLLCHDIDTQLPENSLEQQITAWQQRLITPQSDESEIEFRNRILAKSSPEDPLCFSVFPDLFAAGTQLPLQVEENYLLACAQKIDTPASNIYHSQTLAEWLRSIAAMLSDHNAFIARTFRSSLDDSSSEGVIYGNAIEAYTEIMFNKFRQAEITTLNALNKSDKANLWLLSRQSAILLSYIVSHTETMSGERLTAIVEAIAPQKGWPINVADFRRILQIKVCRMSMLVPDVTSQLVSACLPWLQISASHPDDFEMALLLIEHSIYGSDPNQPAIAPEVLQWLQNAVLSQESERIRHEFAQRMSVLPQLSEQERQILSTL